jgi:hypothetical protein
LPAPARPLVTVIQVVLLTAVHAHPDGAVTATLAVLPVAATACDAGEMA